MQRAKRIRRNSFPLHEVREARVVPGGIQVKIEYPYSGITASSPWMKMNPKHYWINDEKHQIRKMTSNLCELLIGKKVRIPKLEKENRYDIRKQQRDIIKRRNNNV